MNPKAKLLLSSILLLACHLYAGGANAAVTLRSDRTSYPVAGAQVLVDPSKTLTIADVRELERKGSAQWSETSRLNFGYSRARFWLKVPVSNQFSDNGDWILEFGYPLIQVLQFHQFVEGREVLAHETGRLRPFKTRPVEHRTFLFNFSLPKGSSTDLYVMVESVGTVFAPMAIHPRDAFLSQSTRKTAAIGIYAGIMLAMVLTNFFLFLSIRDRNYLFYIGYALTFGLLMNSLNGMTYQYLWPDWVQWNKVSVPVLAGLCYMFLAFFTRSFLETRRLVPVLDRGLDAILAGAAFLIVGGVFDYGLFVNRFTSIFISVAPLVVLPISIRCMQLGSRTAAYYVIAFGCFFLGSATHAARDLAWLPQNFATEYGPYLGSAAEMILLSLGLASRIKRLKEEKLQSELHAVEAERRLAESRKQLEKQVAVADLASQVAHDIRSPLAALDSVIKDVSQLPEEKRIIVRSAVSRIHDIANDLIDRNRETTVAAVETAAEPATRELLSSQVASLVTEKRLQSRSRIGIAIESRSDASSYGLFAEIQPREFKRVLSNLIDNGVEALPGKGAVSVVLARVGDRIQLRIEDDGRGIPHELLSKLGQRGQTFGKPGGLGLGLYHAKTCVEAWGGSLKISSQVDKGTTVSIELPAVEAPAWFVSELQVRPGTAVVVLDDDPTIHQVWQGRFESALKASDKVEVLHFSGAKELRAWSAAESATASRAVYLLDYELRDESETGLSLVKALGLGARAILVTSRYEERPVLDECLRLGVRVIPKGLAGFVPIIVCDRERPDAVLLDDDALVHAVWKLAAREGGKRLEACSTPAELWPVVERLGKETPIYVDVNLADGVRGEDVAERLRAQGFLNLYLTTGQRRDTLTAPIGVKGVIGKAAPWNDEASEECEHAVSEPA